MLTIISRTARLWAVMSSEILCRASSVANRPNMLFAIAHDWGLDAGTNGTPWAKTLIFERICARETTVR